MEGFIESLKAYLNDAIEGQEQQQDEEYNKGQECAIRFAIEMFEKHSQKKLQDESK